MRLPNRCRSLRRARSVLLAAAALVAGSLGAGRLLAQSLSQNAFRNGTEVREAFREVVREPNRWTVHVVSHGRERALGLIVSADGYVLTKRSELRGHVAVRLPDGTLHDARIVGEHKDTDLALLRIQAEGLPEPQWKVDGDPSVGQWVVTPDGTRLPSAVGVLSVGRRRIPPQNGVLGIDIAEAQPGPKIMQVFPNSGAAQAGLQPGDVITAIAGEIVKDRQALAGVLRKFRPGDTLDVRVRRGEDVLSLRAVLGLPLQNMLGRGALQNQMGGDLSMRRDGFPSVLQHDTFLKPGECGGPLVDLQGRVVGLNIARAGRTETYALPAADVVKLLAELKSGKLAPAPYTIPAPPPPALPEKG